MTLWTPNNWQKEHFWPTFSIYFLVMAVTRILPFMENNRTENKSANGRKNLEKITNQNKGIMKQLGSGFQQQLDPSSAFLTSDDFLRSNKIV